MFWWFLIFDWRAWLVGLLLTGIVVSTAMGYWRKRRLARLLKRGDFLNAWKTRFPQCDEARIKGFLRLFVDSFEKPVRAATAFGPEDALMRVYRAKYPLRGEPDCLEFESFSLAIEARYNFDPTDPWRPDMTLGDVFRRIALIPPPGTPAEARPLIPSPGTPAEGRPLIPSPGTPGEG
jgi:hypothetical protein